MFALGVAGWLSACADTLRGETPAKPQVARTKDSLASQESVAFLVKDLSPDDSSPTDLVAVDTTLYFVASTPETGRELWKTDGTESGTVLVKDIRGGAPEPSFISYLTALGNKLYFVADDGVTGNELWVTDGTPEGTVLVADLCPGSCGSGPHGLTEYNGLLYFLSGAGPAPGLWRTDGTAAGTTQVASFYSPFTVGNERMATAQGFLFALGSLPNATELSIWRSNGTPSGTTILAALETNCREYCRLQQLPDGGVMVFGNTIHSNTDVELWLVDGSESGALQLPALPASAYQFTVMGRELFFEASGSTQRGLWKASAARPQPEPVLVSSEVGAPWTLYPVGLGNAVYFQSERADAGWELWATDGNPDVAALVKDIAPGPESGLFSLFGEWYYRQPSNVPLALIPEGVLVFEANDGTTGAELWRTNGTSAGTNLVADIAPGAASSEPFNLTLRRGNTDYSLWRYDPVAPVRSGDLIYFTANDGVHGRELWAARVSDLADYEPPAIQCPSEQRFEAESDAGAVVTYAPATADVSARQIAYSLGGGLFPLGTTSVRATAKDLIGNASYCDFNVVVTDSTPPLLTCPGDFSGTTSDATGRIVSWEPPAATDAVSSQISITVAPPAGTNFPNGQTLVKASAVDDSGNASSCTFIVAITYVAPPAPDDAGADVFDAGSEELADGGEDLDGGATAPPDEDDAGPSSPPETSMDDAGAQPAQDGGADVSTSENGTDAGVMVPAESPDASYETVRDGGDMVPESSDDDEHPAQSSDAGGIADGGTDDAGPRAPEPPEPMGCGCSESQGSFAVWGLSLLCLLGRRGRRGISRPR